jgi:hypothetical protein
VTFDFAIPKKKEVVILSTSMISCLEAVAERHEDIYEANKGVIK